MRSALIVFGRYPVAGRVKSRLAATIGDQRAAELYASFLRDTMELAVRTGARVRLHLAGDRPPRFETDFGPDVDVFGQSGDGLGDRMLDAFAQAFADGFRRACIIGTDHPNLPDDHLKKAFDLLETADACIGPTEDGGYYLLGLRSVMPEMFEGLTYGHSSVFEEATARMRALGMSFRVLDPWYDVDNEADLRRLERALLNEDGCRHTRQTLARHAREMH